MAQIDYLPVATAVGNNSDTQGNFAGSGYQELGFTVGEAFPEQANKIWRQTSMWGAALANWVSQQLGNCDVIDDGNQPALTALFASAVAAGVAAISPPTVMNVVTGARALGTTYTNTSGYKMTCVVEVGLTTGSYGEGFGFSGYVGPGAPSQRLATSGEANGPGIRSITFIVLPGYEYQVARNDADVINAQAPTLLNWTEFIN